MPPPVIPIDAIRQPAWVYGPDGRVTAANDLAEALAGQPLVGCSIAEVGRIFEYRHADGTPFAPDELPASQAFAGEEVLDLAVTVALADGIEREIVATASPIREGDAVTGALVLWQDVTERKRAEEAEARLRALMDHNPGLVFLKDEAGRYVYLNETYERQFVHTKDWRGKTDYDFWPKESAELFRANDREVLASGRAHQFLEDSTGLDGTRYVWLNYKFPFFGAKGERYVGGIGIDATAPLRAEEALRESEAEYRHLVEFAPTGIYEIEYGGPRFRRVNDAVCRVLGYTREELMAMDPSSFLDEESRARFQERARRMIAGEPIDETVAYRLFARDGREIWAELNVQSIFTDGRTTGALVVAHDITERKRAEAALAESEERYRTVIETAGEGFVIAEPDGPFTFVNRRMAEMLGYPVDEILGRSSVDFAFDACVPKVFRSRKALHEGAPDQGEFRFRRKDGTELWTRYTATPLFNAQGDHTANFVFHTDITERKKAEERQAFLLRFNDALRPLSDPAEIQAEAARLLGEHLRANQVHYGETVGDVVVIRQGYGNGLPPIVGRFRHAEFGEQLVAAYRAGRTVVCSNAATDPTITEAEAAVITGSGFRAYLAVPLVKHGEWVATLAAHSIEPRAWTPDEVALVEETAERTWAAIERARAEQAVRESEEQFRRAIEDAPIPIIMHAEDGQVLQLSRTWAELTGYGPGDIPTFDAWLTHAYGEGANAVRDHVQSLFRGESRTIGIEFPVRTRDGDQRYWSFSASSPGTLADGRRYVVGMAVDITGRKRADDVQRETRDYLDSLIDYANAPIIVWDPAFRITRFNAAFEHLSGRAAGEVIGRDLAVLFPPESREESLEKIQRTITERWQTVEIPIQRPDGEVRIALWNSANIYDAEGTLLATIAQGQDITERIEAEAALRENAENLQRSNEDLERFAYVASHDLQEPLRSVVSFSQLLERRYRGQLGADADEYIDFIVEGGTRMQGLILDLLAFSRVNTTRQQIGRTDVEDVLAEAMRTLDVSLREADATLTHDPLPVVMADPTQLAQVFANLVSNAVKFRRPDELLRVHVGARRLDGLWEFSVSDNGIGIAPEYFDKIFVIFQRLHTKETYPGTGIGLAIVKRIIDRHGGRIRVESTPGEGSTFVFTLPAA